MPIDVRVPISGLFGVVGLLLLGYGLAAEGLSTGAGQLNAIWGGVMIVFAAILGYYGRRSELRPGVRADVSAE